MNITATKIFTFDMAHALTGHRGLCDNLHGHTYKLEVTVSRPQDKEATISTGSSRGMVIDFSDLKQVVQEEVLDYVDHATMIYPVNDFEEELLELLNKYDKAWIAVTYRPTAENMVKDFARRIAEGIKRRELSLEIERIKLWETPTSYAEVTGYEL